MRIQEFSLSSSAPLGQTALFLGIPPFISYPRSLCLLLDLFYNFQCTYVCQTFGEKVGDLTFNFCLSIMMFEDLCMYNFHFNCSHY